MPSARSNPLRSALDAGRPQIGTWVNLVRNPAILTLLQSAGLDYARVDTVTLGPSDLAQELGVFGTPSQAEVIDEHRLRLIAAARQHGKHVAMLVQTLEEAERWIAAGAQIIAYSSDVAILRAGFVAAA